VASYREKAPPYDDGADHQERSERGGQQCEAEEEEREQRQHHANAKAGTEHGNCDQGIFRVYSS